MFYVMEILHNERIYNSILNPEKLGYQNFAETSKSNQIEEREADGEHYVRIHKKDGILVRCSKEMGWKSKRMNPGTDTAEEKEVKEAKEETEEKKI